jgi:hypothetical protein
MAGDRPAKGTTAARYADPGIGGVARVGGGAKERIMMNPVRRSAVGLAAMGLAAGVWAVGAEGVGPASGGGGGIESLAWMAGRWRSDGADGLTDEHWSPPVGGSMLGMCRLGADGKKAVYEILLIEEQEGKLVYTMEHFGPGLVHRDKAPLVFDVESGPGRQARFTCRDPGRPTVLTYRQESPEALSIRLERDRGGRKLEDTYRLRRAGGG